MKMMNGVELHEVRVSAPGKVILHGEHSVVYGKTAIAVSLGLRTSIVIKEIHSDTHIVNVDLPAVDLQETIELQPITDKLFDPPFLPGTTEFPWMEPGNLDHEKHFGAVEKFLHETRPDFDSLQSNRQNSLRCFLYAFSGIFGSTKLPVCSMEISMESELTVGAGTGSSASFAVCLTAALIQLVKLKSGVDQEEFSMEDKKIISSWAFNCERITHGSPSGIDNSTCTFGSLISFRKGAGPRVLDLELRLRVLLVDTRVSRETKALAAKVAAFREWNTAAVDSVMDACDHVTHTATEILENLSKTKNITDIQLQYQRLEELWDMNHCLLGALGVSHAALERVRAAARARGLACKLTGAGGGGYAIVLIPPYSDEANITSLKQELEAAGFRATDTRLGGAGVALRS
ncbi:mevalonate kinase [Epargyreus clarus]|uniref:mevalonate kinase n=1 Tax=Epargyreus clarus TaxID=520877 RepID=UPI003C2B3080